MIVHPPRSHGIWRTFIREWRQIFHNPLLIAMTTAVPLLASALLIGVFVNSLPTDLPVGVVDLDASDLSRSVIRMVDATPDVAVTTRYDNLYAGRSAIVAGQIYGLLMLPKNLERDVRAGRRPEVVFFYNTQMLTTGNLALRGASAALQTAEAGLRQSTRMAMGQSQAEASAAMQPIPIDVRPLFNPTMNYAFFLLASLLPSVMQVVIMTTSAYAISIDTASPQRIHRLRRICFSPTSYLIGKLLPYTILFLMMMGVADAVLVGPLEMPIRGDFTLLTFASLLFIIASQLVGTWFGLTLRPVASAVSISTLISAPAFGFMGVGFPRIGMNVFSHGFSALLPGTWYLEARMDQTVRGTPPELGLQPVAILGAFVVVLFVGVVINMWILWRRGYPPRPFTASGEVTP